ncbi:MAG: serine/threonine protein kinase [Williamsia herbipolensis]|nr:serine/threonine protein kinase [Williamsia herbipolensis]
MSDKEFTYADMDSDDPSDEPTVSADTTAAQPTDTEPKDAETKDAGEATPPAATKRVETPTPDRTPSPSSASAAPATDAEKAPRSRRLREFTNPRRHPVVTGLAALCVAAVVATAVLATLYARSSSDLDSARTLAADKQTAETDAGKYAVGAATFDFTNLDTWTASLKRGTAPELSSRFDVAAKTLTPLLQEVQWKQTASLIAAKTIDIRDGRQFVVQVFVSTRMTSTQNPTGLNTVTPYTVTLDRDDNWTITDVAGIDGTPQDRSTGSGVPNLGAGGTAPSSAPSPAQPAPATPTSSTPPPS